VANIVRRWSENGERDSRGRRGLGAAEASAHLPLTGSDGFCEGTNSVE
jgi:hypothetical protein